MPQLLVRCLDANIISRLKVLAARNVHSLAAQLRLILHDAAFPQEPEPALPRTKAARRKPPAPEDVDRGGREAPVPPMPTAAEMAEFRELTDAEALEKAIGVLVLVRYQRERNPLRGWG